MADTKISALSAATALSAGTEEVPIVQSAATVKATVQQIVTAATGATVMSGATITTSSKPVIDLAQTWNDAAVAFTGVKFNATNTTSSSASMLLDLQVGGVTAFNISRAGVVFTGASVRTPTLSVTNINNLDNSNTVFTVAASSSNALFATGATTPIFRFAGATASFPALKRSGVILETKLADDSAYAQHNASQLGLVDGITAPGATVGYARLYVDTADGDLKVVFGDGVVKVVAADT